MKLAADLVAQILALADRIDGVPVAPAGAVAYDAANEKAFQGDVTDLAKREGWRAYHTHNSRRCEPGFPDLVLCRDRVIVAELKVLPNRPTAEQLDWLDSFRAAGVAAYLWYPSDWADIVRVLTAEREWKKGKDT